jgi:TorA maturation chaperone TorD
VSTDGDGVDWARLYALLSECFKHPDEQFLADVQAGRLESELAPLLGELGLEYEQGVDQTVVPETAAAFDNEYISLFEAFETPYAPAAESPYKEWHDAPAAGGLLEGPPADDMRQRYATLDVSVPDAYMDDHLALLLEYASLLVESGTPDQHRAFLAEHLDWIPAFRCLVDEAAAEARFHRRYVSVTDEVLKASRARHGVQEPDQSTVDEMLGRAKTGMEGIPDEKHFRE